MVKFKIRFYLILLLLISLLLSFFVPLPSSHVKMSVIEFFKPALRVFNNSSSSVKDWGNPIVGRRSYLKENERLKKRVEELTARIIVLEEAHIENGRLKALLSFKETLKTNSVAAHVIATDGSNWSDTILLDKGEKDGIKVNSAVVSSDGLVGRVVEVGGTIARVLLITDPDSKVAGLVQSNRESGIVEGIGNNRCRIKYLPLNSDVKKDDVVITSGLSEIAPKGIAIGRVLEVTRDPGGLYMCGILQPHVDLQKIEEVLCIRR